MYVYVYVCACVSVSVSVSLQWDMARKLPCRVDFVGCTCLRSYVWHDSFVCGYDSFVYVTRRQFFCRVFWVEYSFLRSYVRHDESDVFVEKHDFSRAFQLSHPRAHHQNKQFTQNNRWHEMTLGHLGQFNEYHFVWMSRKVVLNHIYINISTCLCKSFCIELPRTHYWICYWNFSFRRTHSYVGHDPFTWTWLLGSCVCGTWLIGSAVLSYEVCDMTYPSPVSQTHSQRVCYDS